VDFSSFKKQNRGVTQKIIDHPFMKELYQGQLDFSIFKFFLKQDYNYLDQSMANMGILISKAEDINIRRKLIRVIYSESEVEFENYIKLLSSLKISPKEAGEVKLTRANIAYSNYLISQSVKGGFARGIAALLPCYYSYLEVYKHHKSELKYNNNHLYLEWASAYKEKSFEELVSDLIEILEKNITEENYQILLKTYSDSLKFEYEFLTDVYYKKRWDI